MLVLELFESRLTPPLEDPLMFVPPPTLLVLVALARVTLAVLLLVELPSMKIELCVPLADMLVSCIGGVATEAFAMGVGTAGAGATAAARLAAAAAISLAVGG